MGTLTGKITSILLSLVVFLTARVNINFNLNFAQKKKKDKNEYDKNDTPKVRAEKIINRAFENIRKEIEEKKNGKGCKCCSK